MVKILLHNKVVAVSDWDIIEESTVVLAGGLRSLRALLVCYLVGPVFLLGQYFKPDLSRI